MSILLSAYFAEGIVFAADKNLTFQLAEQATQVDEGVATKVIPWANRRAVVGFCHRAILAGIPMDEWLRQFVAQTRDFEDISVVAEELRSLIEEAYQQDYPEGSDLNDDQLIVHLGGFRYEHNSPVPVMYFIRNVTDFDVQAGVHRTTLRNFLLDDELINYARAAGIVNAREVRPWLSQVYESGNYQWFNNGVGLGFFNKIKDGLWDVLRDIRATLPDDGPSLANHRAFCAMAVEAFGSFYRFHEAPERRFVGGGVDFEWVPWPEA